MLTFEATEDGLLRVMLACDSFRRHWAKFRAMPHAPTFEGVPDDIRALDYLIYEGLDYPEGDIEDAALVWGNVLAQQAGFRWVCSYQGDLLLRWGELDPYVMGAAIWPYGRLLEADAGGVPMAERFGRMTWQVVASCLANDPDPGLVANLRLLADEFGPD